MDAEQQKTLKRAALRRATLRLVMGVATLDLVAIAVWYFAGVSNAEPRTRLVFTVAWTIATAIVVSFFLKKVRKVRFSS